MKSVVSSILHTSARARQETKLSIDCLQYVECRVPAGFQRVGIKRFIYYGHELAGFLPVQWKEGCSEKETLDEVECSRMGGRDSGPADKVSKMTELHRRHIYKVSM